MLFQNLICGFLWRFRNPVLLHIQPDPCNSPFQMLPCKTSLDGSGFIDSPLPLLQTPWHFQCFIPSFKQAAPHMSPVTLSPNRTLWVICADAEQTSVELGLGLGMGMGLGTQRCLGSGFGMGIRDGDSGYVQGDANLKLGV
uniref:Uncharacterized protein n=1 Tax=Eutreptiella gymnastica TaxID=73025 RepID=A0A7S4FU49_9EUGL